MDDAMAEVAAIRARLAEIERAFQGPDEHEGRRSAIVAAAVAARFRNPELAARILAGRDGDAAELVGELAQAEPYLVTRTMNELLRAAARSE